MKLSLVLSLSQPGTTLIQIKYLSNFLCKKKYIFFCHIYNVHFKKYQITEGETDIRMGIIKERERNKIMKKYIIIDEHGILQEKFIDETFVCITEKQVLSGKIPKKDFSIKAKISKIKKNQIKRGRCIIISDNLFVIEYVDRFICRIKCIDGNKNGITRDVPTVTLCEFLRIIEKYS